MKKYLTLLLSAFLVLTAMTVSLAEPLAEDVINRFTDTWVAEGFTAEIGYDTDAAAFTCDLVLNDGTFAEYTDCTYDSDSDTLVCKGGSRFTATYNEATGDYDKDVHDTDLTAVFSEKDDRLTCQDGLLKDVVFLRLDDAEEADAEKALFNEEDFRQAVALIDEQFSTWEGCEMVTCRYAGDENCNEKELQALNNVSEGKHYTACMLFLTDIIGPSELEEVSAWEEPNQELKDYGWWLAREDDGPWELVTWGYC